MTINKTGSGLGTVTSSSSTAINCGTTCAATFTYNTDVTITATPDAGQSFVGWDSPVCQGRLGCTIRMTKDTVVNAVFSPPPNIVFVTSTRHSANLGGLAGADAICAARATAGTLPGTYRAWLSTSTVNAKDRLGTASGWVRPDGKPVLNQLNDIEKSKIFYPPSLDEFGITQAGVQTVMTGTGSNGTLAEGSSLTTCGDWTSNVDEPSKWYEVGMAGSSSSAFTAYGGNQCTMSSQLYCFGIDRTAFVAPDPMQGRRAFTTYDTWAPGAGIESADTLCQQEAAAAGLSGTFRALLAPTGASAASRFVGTDPWCRMDGLALATSASAFFSSSNIDVAPALNAKGEYSGRQMIWTGAQSMTTAGTDDVNCNNWMSALSTASSRAGFGDMSYTGLFFGTNISTYPCNGRYHLVCLQTP